ncbi:hypothetical protein IGI04_037885 [Brassica rapa subsp. trilocularis]|uniref:Uncharacterized protein n=1 Tax=Brassica rapa subsp. trilocularis TaxID=1813537 RepID=A0ABQ7LIM6_BRACM|nr:hypothetical protein IGI04_037885 [Brassica rapa subsp. trilocularis]
MTSIVNTGVELDNNGSATDGFEEISRCLCGSTYFIIISTPTHLFFLAPTILPVYHKQELIGRSSTMISQKVSDFCFVVACGANLEQWGRIKHIRRCRDLGLAPPQLSPRRLKTEWSVSGGMLLVWLVSTLPTPSPGKTIRTSKKEEEMKKGELEADTDKLMREEGTRRISKPSSLSKLLTVVLQWINDLSQIRKTDSSKKKKSKKRKHYASSESSSSSDEDESRRSRSSSKRSTKEKKHKSSRDKRSNKSKHETDGPVPLSRFFGNLKS